MRKYQLINVLIHISLCGELMNKKNRSSSVYKTKIQTPKNKFQFTIIHSLNTKSSKLIKKNPRKFNQSNGIQCSKSVFWAGALPSTNFSSPKRKEKNLHTLKNKNKKIIFHPKIICV